MQKTDPTQLQNQNAPSSSNVSGVGNGVTKSEVPIFQVPVLSLPTGGGAIRGIDEKFQVNAISGTSSFTIPVPLSSTRHGFTPSIALDYNSGNGNSPFGLGWQVNIPSIARKTERKLPEYNDEEESDTFVLSGAEDLTPLLEKTNVGWVRYKKTRTEDGIDFTVTRYRPRIEGLFARIEKWKAKVTGEVHWRTISRDNVHSFFGITDDSRTSDPKNPTRVFEWKLCRTFDDKGNVTIYKYKKEKYFENVPKRLNEKNRIGNSTQLYLKEIWYGNKQPYFYNDPPPGANDFMFRVIFDYGEHDPSGNIPRDVDVEKNEWLCRNDPFSTCRPGFEIRTHRQCHRILVFHCFDANELPFTPYLTRSVQLFYDNKADDHTNIASDGFSYLRKARQNGHIWDANSNSYKTKSLPDIAFRYQHHEWNKAVKDVEKHNLAQLPAGLSDKNCLWIDLFNEGVSGILIEQETEWYYKSNLGNGNFSQSALLSAKPMRNGLRSGNVSIQELEGNGVKYAVHSTDEPKGFLKLTGDDEWQPFKTFASFPNVDLFDANLRMIDLNGDGIADLLITEEDKFRWYTGNGEQGFKVSRTISKEIDEEKGPAIVFADSMQSIFLADLNGDGLTDIVRIRNGDICYWPSLGYGKFGAKVSMDNAPLFDGVDTFNPSFLRLADIDGSGTTDIVYLGKNDFRVWMNLSGNAWTAQPQIIRAFPSIDNLSDVSVLDFLGTGTACIVNSSPVSQQPLQYINLMGGKKPHVLNKYENNCGKEVTIEYKPSTQFYLEDKARGIKWITKLSFPVHCIHKIRSEDKIRKTVFISAYNYRHGYFDFEEREFRGFARVEQLDTEDFLHFRVNDSKNVVEEHLHQAPVRTITWFHTGAFLGSRKIIHQCQEEYFKNIHFKELTLPEPSMPDALTAEELREAHRACKGLPLRVEVYGVDQSERSSTPYTASQSTYEVHLVQPRGNQQFASFRTSPAESISYSYERNAGDPRIAHSFIIEQDDIGNPVKTASVVYPRVSRPGNTPDKVWTEQNKLHILYGETLYTGDIIEDTLYRLRQGYESRSYELSGIGQPADFFFSRASLRGIIAQINANPAAEILYEEEFTGAPQKRLSSQSRTYFINNALNGALNRGELSRLGIPYKSYSLAFTKGLVSKYYGSKVSDQMLADAGYVHLQGDQHWWTQSGVAVYGNNPQANFYSPVASRDVFNNETEVEYDRYTLLVKSTTDAIGNRSVVENDYRTLSPTLLTDPNLNRSAIETDALGFVIKSAIMGKAGAGEGDTLADPTAKMEYNLLNWQNNKKPNYVRILAREKHGPSNPRWQESYGYSDGGGSVIMSKVGVKPGKAQRWNPVTNQVDEVDANPRWIGNGRTIVNNKGLPIKQFEPYFSTTHEYEDEDKLVETGISPLLFYDPLGRNTRTDYPNGTFSKIEFHSWHSKAFDVNDTVKDSQWYKDRGSPEPATDPEPLDPEQRAAWLAAKHHNTPAVSYSDSQGRSFYRVADYGGGKTSVVYSESDLTGRYSKMYDQMDRNVAESYANLLGAAIYGKTAEKGERWIFTDVMGRLVRIWDNNIRVFRTTYDSLHRPISAFVLENGNEILFNHVLYGDYVFSDIVAQNLNMKGRVYRVYDQGGSVTIKKADFKGNGLEIERRLIKDYKARVTNWKALDGLLHLADIETEADDLLESEAFSAGGDVDALNRPTLLTAHEGTVYQPTYDEGGSLGSLGVKIQGQGGFITFLQEQDYDARGHRQFARYGNGTVTKYSYDPKTYRLTNLTTRLSLAQADSQSIQNLKYTFDPVGNITQVRDDAQQTHYFRNSVVYPENKYEYDAVYQLKRASGREHAGLGGNAQRTYLDLPFIAQLPHLNDPLAVRDYTEYYFYDDCGNIKTMQHVARDANWTRRYRYEYEDVPTDATNRLKASSAEGDAEDVFSDKYFHDLHGNITSMPHLSTPGSMIWNFMDQLKEVDLGGGGKAYYVYGSGGNRIRKVIERRDGKILERIYLGTVEIYRERKGNSAPDLERYTIHVSDNAGRIAQVDVKTIDKNNSDPSNALNARLIRYQYGNHLGSACIETDNAGNIISYEEYHPYGTSSYRVSKSDVDLSLKRYRFSGKERDEETGFYYFGARYYASWLGRWTSSDPAGFVDGLNAFYYTQNNPVTFSDRLGFQTNAPGVEMPEELKRHLTINKKESAEMLKQYMETSTLVIKQEVRIYGKDLSPGTYKITGGTMKWVDGEWAYDPDVSKWEKVGSELPVDSVIPEEVPPSTGRLSEDSDGRSPTADKSAQELPATEEPDSKSKKQEHVEEEEGFWESTVSGKSEPSFGKSLIPVIGSVQSANYHFSHGNWGRGILYTGLAITDIFLVRSIIAGGIKLLAKGGAKLLGSEIVQGITLALKGNWRAFGNTLYSLKTAFWNFRAGSLSKNYWEGTAKLLGMQLQHLWVLNSTRWVPRALRNSGLNLLEIPAVFNHWMGGIAFREHSFRLFTLTLLKASFFGAYDTTQALMEESNDD